MLLGSARGQAAFGPRATSWSLGDLFATPWRTFHQITFPQLTPAILAGFLLSFTFSFDDYVITSFVSEPGHVHPAALHLRPGQEGRHAETSIGHARWCIRPLVHRPSASSSSGATPTGRAAAIGMAAMIAEQR
ncbi:MAG: ABC transporter permease subunit [Chloroflexota bacterium]